ncbi:MAG TPA: 3-dehydroquinate synthase family protein [Phycisphaerales bacterium]|nr:3-dehydroquinate synthase family protein [Phycisphaerales bacterium]
MSHTVRVNLGSRSYDVAVGVPADAVGDLLRRVCPSAARCFVVADPACSTSPITTSLIAAGLQVRVWNMDDPDGQSATGRRMTAGTGVTESVKSLDTVEHLCGQFAAAGLDRRDAVLAVGGGIVGDLAGFAAAIYRRGIAWVNMPTTLLAMVDASVGGKTGANLFTATSTVKNMAGAFHQPSLVVIDPNWLATLPPRHLRAGLAECIKHALLYRSVPGFGDHDLWNNTSDIIRRADLVRDPSAVADLIARNVTLKARVVEHDEFEIAPDATGGRALLNLGHTFAHVIEGLPGQDVLHGEAVGLGLVAAAHTARSLGRVDQEFVQTVCASVSGAGLPTSLAGLPTCHDLTQRMRGDKKTLGGKLRLILPGPGVWGYAGIVADPPDTAVHAGWDAIRA